MDKEQAQPNQTESKDEQIGFHKGALSTLAKERQELGKMLQVVEKLMQLHLEELENLGVDMEEEIKQAKQQAQEMQQGSDEELEEKLGGTLG